jgi:hypothetical protein
MINCAEKIEEEEKEEEHLLLLFCASFVVMGNMDIWC